MTEQTPKKETIMDVPQFLRDLDGGVFERKLALAMQDVSSGVIQNVDGASGSVTVVFKMKRIGLGAQLMVEHSLETKRPTPKGHRGEKNTTETPMYVDPAGDLTLFPKNQIDIFGRED